MNLNPRKQMSPTQLTDDLRRLKGKEVVVVYGTRPVREPGTLVSWTSGVGAKVYITRGENTHIHIPIKDIQKVEAA